MVKENKVSLWLGFYENADDFKDRFNDILKFMRSPYQKLPDMVKNNYKFCKWLERFR